VILATYMKYAIKGKHCNFQCGAL